MMVSFWQHFQAVRSCRAKTEALLEIGESLEGVATPIDGSNLFESIQPTKIVPVLGRLFFSLGLSLS